MEISRVIAGVTGSFVGAFIWRTLQAKPLLVRISLSILSAVIIGFMFGVLPGLM
jgi:hypothetical protein